MAIKKKSKKTTATGARKATKKRATRKATKAKPKPALKKAAKKVVKKTAAKKVAKKAAKKTGRKTAKKTVRKTSIKKSLSAEQIASQLVEILKKQVPPAGSALPLALVAPLFSPASQEVVVGGMNILVGQGVLALQGESYVFTGQFPVEEQGGKAGVVINVAEVAKFLAQNLQQQGTPAGTQMPSIEALRQMTNGVIPADILGGALEILTAQGVLNRTPEGAYMVTGAWPN